MAQWPIWMILVTLIERIYSQSSLDISDDYPLTKALGYSIRNQLSRTLDARLSQKFMDKYQEIRKASQESFENFQKRDEKRHRRVVGDDEFDLMKEGTESVLLNRRRNPNKLESAAGRRRARSQAIRRNKLNSQGLKSHVHHSKQTELDYVND